MEQLDPDRQLDVDEATFAAVFDEAVEALTQGGIPFVVMGGISSALLGRNRWTHDIDFFLRREDARPALDLLAERGFEPEETFWDWLYKAEKKQVVVDIIFRSTGGILFEEEMVTRSRPMEVYGITAPVIPPEDLLVMKAVVHDEHMPRHWHDALGLVSRCELDWDYVVYRAKRHGARRVLALLLYAQSNDLIVPNRVIESLFEAIYRS